MPHTLGLLALSLFSAGWVGAANLVVGLQGILVGAGLTGATLLSVGLSFLSSLLFAPKQPKPEDVQNSVRNPTAPRARIYGRMKVSGPWVFAESKNGDFWKVLALQTGEADAFEEYWVDDRLVTVDVGGNVATDPYDGNLNIYSRLGLPTETHYTELGAAFPEWGADHRGDGIASLCIKQDAVSQERIMELFPNGINTSYRVVGRWSKVLNPVTDFVEWSDNAAAVILDYATHADGARLPTSLFNTPQAVAGWIAAFNRCAEAVPLKAGGTELLFRLWGAYTFDERPADVFGRMLQCSDARFAPTPDGGVTLEIGAWEEPTVILDEDAIVGFSEFSRGLDIMSTANVIKATFLSIAHDYQATDAQEWINEADVAARGEVPTSVSFNMAPSHGQARRLMKLAAYRSAPAWIGTVQCNLRALAAFGKRYIRITYPLFGLDEVFEVADFRFDIDQEKMILQGVTLSVRSMPEESSTWDAETEEGDPPIAETTEVDRTIPVPTGFTFTEEIQTSNSQPFSVGVLEWNAPPSLSLRVEAQYRKVGAANWLSLPVPVAGLETQTGALQDGVEYEAQIRHVSSTGRFSEWTSPSLKMTPLANPTAPLALVSFAATGGQLGRSTLSITTAASDPNIHHVDVYRVPTGVTLDKNVHTRIRLGALAGTTLSYVDGDATRVNVIANPGFDSDTVWTKGTWTIASGLATHPAGAISILYQSTTFASADVLRVAYTVSGRTAGTVASRAEGSTSGLVHGAFNTGNQRYREEITVPTIVGTPRIGWRGDASFDGSIDNVSMYVKTAACAPQGTWDYYAFPVNGSGVEGPQATSLSISID